MRGDRPHLIQTAGQAQAATPHARGSTLGKMQKSASEQGYPACAGIDLEEVFTGCEEVWLPRMRGDRPTRGIDGDIRVQATPHARGSTPYGRPGEGHLLGYPACAGIDPINGLSGRVRFGLPRMRGDRPYFFAGGGTPALATPHARGSTFV